MSERPRNSLPFAAAFLATLALCLSFTASSLAANSDAPRQPLPGLSFTLADQFGREYTEAYCAGKTTIFMIYDRGGGKYGGAWGAAIGRELSAAAPAPIQWINVTTLRGIPSFLHKTAAKYLPKDRAQWTLLDWNACFAETYRVPANHLGILVCDPQGRAVCCESVQGMDTAVLSSIVAAIISGRNALARREGP